MRAFWRALGVTYNEAEGFVYSRHSPRNVGAYWYADWLFTRIARRKFYTKGQLQRLWRKIAVKYGYSGGPQHNPTRYYFDRVLYRYGGRVSDGPFSPLAAKRIGPHENISCRICGRPFGWACAEEVFIGESGERIKSYEPEQLFGRYKSLTNNLCDQPRCNDVLEWELGISHACYEARRLKVQRVTKEYRDAAPTVAYLDFMARLKTAKEIINSEIIVRSRGKAS